MKRQVTLALVALAIALSAVPFALADGGTPTAGTASAGQAHGRILVALRLRLHRIEVRFAHHCGTGASTAPAGCVEIAQRLEQRLQTLNGRLEKLIQTIQSTCTATSTDPRCTNADRKVAFLQKVDAGVQKLAQKLGDWLKS
jgi:hypothetical protein